MADCFAELNHPVPEGFVNTNENAYDSLFDWLARCAPLELSTQDLGDNWQTNGDHNSRRLA